MTMFPRYYLAFTLLFSPVSHLQAADIDYYGQPGDEIELDDIPDIPVEPIQMRVPSDLLALSLQDIREPLWKSTRAPAGRDMLYLLPQKITALEYGGVSAKFFYNMTNRMKMAVDDVFTLPDITAAGIQQVIQTLIPAGSSTAAFEQLIPLFRKITLQERKAGVLVQGGAARGPFTLQLASSLQVGERNFWLSKRDQAAIGNLFQGSSVEEKELYEVRAGLGDTRLKVGLNTLNMTSFQNDLGFEVIVPTSRLTQSDKMARGIAQVSFNPNNNDELKEKALASLRAVRDYLLTPRLGNGGHFGLGCYAEQKIGLFHNFAQLWIRASYDIFLQNEEGRSFIFRPTQTAADMADVSNHQPNITNYPGMNDAETQAFNDKRVTEFLLSNVLPSSFKATVVPGPVTNVVVAVTVDWNKRWRSAWGYDFYAQREEWIKRIHNASVDLRDLVAEIAQAPSVYQHKLFSETLYHTKSGRSDIGIGYGGDVTVSSKRIGQDWTAYLKCAITF